MSMVEADYKYKKNSVLLGCGGRKFLPFFIMMKYNISKKFEFKAELTMTIEEVFSDLYDKYGEDFNWCMLPLTQADGMFVTELKNEIGEDHFLYDKRIWAVAKCESNDDVLYVTNNGRNADIYYVFHLTYSKHNSDGFPRYEELKDVYAVKAFIEQSII